MMQYAESPTSQPGQRRYARFRDQHGRVWGATIEVRSNGRVGDARPEFDAPIYPPDKYIKAHPDDPFAILIDYDEWESDSRRATKEYEETVREWAVKLGLSGQIHDAITNPPPEIRDLAGPPPTVTDPVVIQAARAGNSWVLKGEGPKPAAAEPYFPEPIKKVAEQTASPSAPMLDPFSDMISDASPEWVPPSEYKLEMGAPGKWRMPDGKWFAGNHDDARENLANNFEGYV